MAMPAVSTGCRYSYSSARSFFALTAAASSSRGALLRRPAAAPLTPAGVGAELRNPLRSNRGAYPRHEILVISEVDCRQQDRAEHLVASDKMVKVSARKIARRRARARLVDRS